MQTLRGSSPAGAWGVPAARVWAYESVMSDPFAAPVRDSMSSGLVSVRPTTPLTEVLRTLERHNVSCVAVTADGGEPLGVVSTTDLARVAKFDPSIAAMPLQLPSSHTARDLMRAPLITVDEDDSVHAAADRMIRNRIHRVFVTARGKVVGVLSTRDVMRAVLAARLTTPLSTVMTTPVETVDLGESIEAALVSTVPGERNWAVGGLQYAGYNLAVIPAILGCARHQRTRRDSLLAGLLCGPVAILPGLCLYVALLGVYPAALQAPIPLHLLLERLGAPWLEVALQVVIFGTLVQTGVGVLQGFTERLFSGRTTTPRRDRWRRTVASVAVTLFALFVADRIGIVGLVARGYGTLSWVVIATFVVPLLWNRLVRRTPPATRARMTPGP